VYIGLALTARNADATCEAVFSNVSFPDTTVDPQWIDQDIGIQSNAAEPMYVAIANNTGPPAVVYHKDPSAAQMDTFTEWHIDLKDFSDQGVDLNDVNSIAIGFGDRDNPQPGGSGKIYFDDIRVYRPRCVPDELTLSIADLNSDCLVDYRDLEIMTNDWLDGDYTIQAETPQPATAWWKFDDNANDSAGTNHGTASGNPTYAAGKLGQAISLDGDDHVDCGNSSVLNFGAGDWTVAAWIKTTQSGKGDENKGTVFANGGDQSGGVRYTLAMGESQSGIITLTTDDDSTKAQATGSTLVNDDAWHHVVGMRNGTDLRVYVDGALAGTNTVPAGYDLSGTSQHNAYIGVITDHTDGSLVKPYVGLIDDVRIYSYALSPAELVSAMGQSEFYVPLTSPANISDEEPVNSKKVNFKDFAVLAGQWLDEQLWP
jgi:hypothetical protein